MRKRKLKFISRWLTNSVPTACHINYCAQIIKKTTKLHKTCQAYFPENGPVMIIKKSVRSKLSEKTFAFE